MNLLKHLPRTGALVTLAMLFMLLGACGVTQRSTSPPGTGVTVSSSSPAPSRSLNSVQRELYEAHTRWQGTPYVWGGNGSQGVDCSSLTQIIFDEHFGVTLPRHTSQQIQKGRGVRRSSAMPGDLVFFRTTRRDLHVGIIINGNEFLHASTSAGVMISSMDERYWSTRFLGVRRVL